MRPIFYRPDEKPPQPEPVVLNGREAHQFDSLVTYQNALRAFEELSALRTRVLADCDRAEVVLEAAKREHRKVIS